MSLHPLDLFDPDAVDDYLRHRLAGAVTEHEVADVRALAERGLALADPPAGAHVLRARLAELEGDLGGFADHTGLALAADPTFGPALDDQEHLAFLQAGAGRRASPARRAELLFEKADRWSGRAPQRADTLGLAARVLGVEEALDHPALVALVAQWQFLAFLLFEGGLLARFEADCGPFLSGAERSMLAGWHGTGHRLVRLEHQRARRGTFRDLVSDETLDVTILHDEGCWMEGRAGLALLVPAGPRLALISEPMLVNEETAAIMGERLAAGDVLGLAAIALQLCVATKLEAAIAEQDERLRFVLPDADPQTFDFTCDGVLDDLRRTHPRLAARADGGDVRAEVRLLLEAIVAERIITLRVPRTWELAQDLMAEGIERTEALALLRGAVAAELVERRRMAS